MIQAEILEVLMANPAAAPRGDSSYQDHGSPITGLLQYGLDDLRQTLIDRDMAQAGHVELSLVICPYDGPELRLLELLEAYPYAGNLRAIHDESGFHLLGLKIAGYSRYPRLQHFRAIGPLKALSAHRRLEMMTRLAHLASVRSSTPTAPSLSSACATT